MRGQFRIAAIIEVVDLEISRRYDRLIETALDRDRPFQILSAYCCTRSVRPWAFHAAVQELNIVAALEQHYFEREARVQICALFIKDAKVRPLHDKLSVWSVTEDARRYRAARLQREIIPERRHKSWRNHSSGPAGPRDTLSGKRTIVKV